VKSVFMAAARMRKKVDRAPLKPSKGLEMTVGEVERLYGTATGGWSYF